MGILDTITTSYEHSGPTATYKFILFYQGDGVGGSVQVQQQDHDHITNTYFTLLYTL